MLFFEEGVTLASCTLEFNGNNSLITLGKSRHAYRMSVSVFNNCVFSVGRDNYFNGPLKTIVSEERTVFIGDDCLFSFGVWIRTADPHLVYDAHTKKRMNPSKDVFIGDHVGLGRMP